MPQNAHQGLHYFSLIQQLLDTTSGNKLYLFKFKKMYGKELKFCLCWGFKAQSTQCGHVEPGQFA